MNVEIETVRNIGQIALCVWVASFFLFGISSKDEGENFGIITGIFGISFFLSSIVLLMAGFAALFFAK